MSNIAVIRSGMNPDLVLEALNGQVVVSWIDLTNPAQQWIRTDHNQTFTLTNVATNTGMAASSASQGGGIIVSGTGDMWSLGGGSPEAIQYAANTGLNVNIPGGNWNLGTQVVLWSWGGGAGNETWTLTNIADISPFQSVTTQLFAGGGSATCLCWQNNQFTVEFQGIPSQNPPFLFTMTTWSTGYSFQNQSTGQFLTYTGNNQIVGQSNPMNIDALWTFGGLPSGQYYQAVRPWVNAGMNLNVFGNDNPQPGSQVGVWNWGGGEPNEVWYVSALFAGGHEAALRGASVRQKAGSR